MGVIAALPGRSLRMAKRRVRSLVFPALLNLWPALLLVSQKAFVPLGMLLVGWGTARYRRNVLVALAMVSAGGLTFLLQRPNEHAAAHFVGYLLFVLAVPLINEAVREDAGRLVHWLAWLSVGNATLAFVFYFLQIDLTAFRGLNRIVGDDDLTHRVYYESTSLIAVFAVTGIKQRWQRIASTLLVLAYALLLAKSVFVMVLWALNLVLPAIARGSMTQRIASTVAIATIAILGPLAVAALRPDVALSIGIKVLQIETILSEPGSRLWGTGWGHVVDEIVNSEDQPYQVEMQLPMLTLQLGLVGVLVHAAGMWALIRSASTRSGVAALRWLAYLAIGLNNPWLLVPSWYLTSILLFRSLEKRP